MWSFVVMAISIVVDLSRSRALATVAQAAPEPGARGGRAPLLHRRLVVHGGASSACLGVWFSHRTGLAWLARADAVAALGVAGIAALVSVRLGRKAVDDLLDAAPTGLLERIARAAAGVDEVVGVSQVRVRRSGRGPSPTSSSRWHGGSPSSRRTRIAHAAEDAIHAAVLDVDVMVHTEPADGEVGRPGARHARSAGA